MARRVAAREQRRQATGEQRVYVGIDPSRAALQIAAYGEQHREHRIPLGPVAVARLEAIIGERPAGIAIERAHSTRQLLLLELVARRHDVREVQPVVSKRFRQALCEDHTDRSRVRPQARRGQGALGRPALPRSPALPHRLPHAQPQPAVRAADSTDTEASVLGGGQGDG